MIAALLALVAILLTPSIASAQLVPTAQPTASAPSLRIRVRGSAEVHAIASTDAKGVSLRGELIDDTGSPIPLAQINVRAFSADASRTPLRLHQLAPCEGSTRRFPRASSTDEVTIETDERGSFCARLADTPAPKLIVKLRFSGNKLHDASGEIEVPIDPEEQMLIRTVLRFEPPPESIDLDRDSITVTASLRVDRSEASRRVDRIAFRREGLPLLLEDERGERIAEAITGGDGRARFDVKTERLAGPGAGELVARFAGGGGFAKASASQPVIRRAEVHVALAHAIDRGDAESGITVDVDVSTARGPVSGGVVEIFRDVHGGRESIGTGAVAQGRARVVAAFAAGGMTRVPIAIRYISAAPWYEAGPELRVDLELAGPGIFKQALVAIVVIATALWIVGGWRRAPKAAASPSDDVIAAPPSGRAGVKVLAPSAGTSGWRGVVTDAHEGTPVHGARLRIIAPTFEGDGVVAETTTDERGEFTLAAPHRSDARLVVDSAEHSAYEQALPPPSVLGVALVTRRRALLDRMVRWARRQGAPFDGAPEPTPGHVRRAAGRAQAPQIEEWASHLEAAAYGPDQVSADTEQQIRAAEPRPAR